MPVFVRNENLVIDTDNGNVILEGQDSPIYLVKSNHRNAATFLQAYELGKLHMQNNIKNMLGIK